jgi:hypothetical protein
MRNGTTHPCWVLGWRWDRFRARRGARRAPPCRAQPEATRARDREPVRNDGIGPVEEPGAHALRSRYAKALGTEGPAAPQRSAATRPVSATTWWWCSAATEPSKRRERPRGSETPLTVLPGRIHQRLVPHARNPDDVVDAIEHLLRIADDFHPRASGPWSYARRLHGGRPSIARVG